MKIRIGHPILEDEYNRETISYSEQRTIRTLDMVRENDLSIKNENLFWIENSDGCSI
jgi:hypothetical protein